MSDIVTSENVHELLKSATYAEARSMLSLGTAALAESTAFAPASNNTTKADVTYVDAELATKSDTTYVDTQLSAKANTTYVNTQLDTKADTATVNTQLDTKADTATVNTQLSAKADTATVNTQLDTKADTATVNTQLSAKADTATVNTQLSAKADTTYVDSELDAKVDKVAVGSIAALKAFTDAVDNQSVEVLGYETEGDGGGGAFYWQADSEETNNDGTIIQATGVTTGRWKRVYSGAVHANWFGAFDGTTTHNDFINESITAISTSGGGVLSLAGVWLIEGSNPTVDTYEGIKLQDNVTLDLTAATIVIKPNDKKRYAGLNLFDIENAHVIGGTIIGDVYAHTIEGVSVPAHTYYDYVDEVAVALAGLDPDRVSWVDITKPDYRSSDRPQYGESGHGIYCQETADCTITGTLVKNCWGDGLYLRANTRTLVSSVVSDNNRRQGLSFISGTECIVESSIFSNTADKGKLANTGGYDSTKYGNLTGTTPSAGIDIEPNRNSDVIAGITVSDCVFMSNAGTGFLVALGLYSDTVDENGVVQQPVQITANNIRTSYNVVSGMQVTSTQGNKGVVQVNNFTSYRDTTSAFNLVRSDLKVRINDFYIVDPLYGSSEINNYRAAAILLRLEDDGYDYGNVEINGLYISDSAGTLNAKSFAAIYMLVGGGTVPSSLTTVDIHNVELDNVSELVDFNTVAANTTWERISITRNNPPLYSFSSGTTVPSSSLKEYLGLIFSNVNGRLTYDLSTSGVDQIGVELEFQVSVRNLMTINFAASGLSGYTDTQISSSTIGDYVKLRCVGENTWRIVESQGFGVDNLRRRLNVTSGTIGTTGARNYINSRVTNVGATGEITFLLNDTVEVQQDGVWFEFECSENTLFRLSDSTATSSLIHNYTCFGFGFLKIARVDGAWVIQEQRGTWSRSFDNGAWGTNPYGDQSDIPLYIGEISRNRRYINNRYRRWIGVAQTGATTDWEALDPTP